MSHLFLLTGASGAGKSTILKALLQDPELALTRFVTSTTRAKRPGEEHGKDYWFISRYDFLKRLEQGDFFEWAEVYGNLYGSSKEEYQRIQNVGLNNIMVVDVQGARALKSQLPDAITFFIDADPKEMHRRIQARGTTEADMRLRTAEVKKESLYKTQADYVVENTHGKLDEAIQHTKDIILSLV